MPFLACGIFQMLHSQSIVASIMPKVDIERLRAGRQTIISIGPRRLGGVGEFMSGDKSIVSDRRSLLVRRALLRWLEAAR